MNNYQSSINKLRYIRPLGLESYILPNNVKHYIFVSNRICASIIPQFKKIDLLDIMQFLEQEWMGNYHSTRKRNMTPSSITSTNPPFNYVTGFVFTDSTHCNIDLEVVWLQIQILDIYQFCIICALYFVVWRCPKPEVCIHCYHFSDTNYRVGLSGGTTNGVSETIRVRTVF